MGMSPLYDLLFESAGSVTVDCRIPMDETNCRQIGKYAREVRDAIQSTVDVIAALNLSARNREIPTADLESFTTQVIDDLHQFVRALDEFSDHAELVTEDGTGRR